jgi:ribosome maturation factor RimP
MTTDNAQDNGQIQAQITALATKMLAPTPAYFVVEVVVRGRVGATRKVEVLVDGDEGIGIDEVVSLSRQLSAALEEQDLISGTYLLEVGSPGVDHPLSSPRQFAKNVGRSLRIELADGTALLGTLAAADATQITLQPDPPKGHKKKDPDPEPIHLAYDAFKQAVVQVKF